MKTIIVAHRGASRDAPENTIPAFRLAWEQGADAIEGDFHLTMDGHIVCIHDRNTSRVAGTKLIVRESTLAQLRELDAGAHHGDEFRGATIPTIEEVFATIPDHKKIYIEIKCGPEIVPVLLKTIENSGLKTEQVVVISFNCHAIQTLKAEAPDYRTCWLCSFQKDDGGNITPPLEDVLETMVTARADGLSSNMAIPESILEAVRKKGYGWRVWTVDDPETARRAIALGVSSITTNVPGYLKQNLGD